MNCFIRMGPCSLALSPTFQVGCKLSLVFFQYCIMANFYWLLVEGLYLHTLLVAIFSPSRRFAVYLLIGWGKDCPPLCMPDAHQPPHQPSRSLISTPSPINADLSAQKNSFLPL